MEPQISELVSLLKDLKQGDHEENLSRFYEIGRREIQDQKGLLKVVEQFHQALLVVLQGAHSHEDCVSAVKVAAEALSSSLSPFEMTQRGYRESVELLTESNRQLEAFSYSVAHDLRNPLSGIIAFGEILANKYGELMGEEASHLFGNLLTSAHKMDFIIKALLELSHVGKQNLQTEEVNLSKISQGIMEDLQRTSMDRQLTLKIGDNILVQADKQLMTVLMTNLLSNAYKYTSKKPVAEIIFDEEMQGGQRVFFVRDNGAGFDMAGAENLFTPFRRLHSYTEFEGIGVGLSTVKRVVERYKGKIWVKAEKGKGAAFYFTLSP